MFQGKHNEIVITILFGYLYSLKGFLLTSYEGESQALKVKVITMAQSKNLCWNKEGSCEWK